MKHGTAIISKSLYRLRRLTRRIKTLEAAARIPQVAPEPLAPGETPDAAEPLAPAETDSSSSYTPRSSV